MKKFNEEEYADALKIIYIEQDYCYAMEWNEFLNYARRTKLFDEEIGGVLYEQGDDDTE